MQYLIRYDIAQIEVYRPNWSNVLSFTEMSALELQQHLEDSANQPILLDVREAWELEKCQLPHTVHVPMREIPSTLSQFDLDAEIVIICHHGIRSRAVANYMAQQDFSRVINLSGGIDQWAKQVDPHMASY